MGLMKENSDGAKVSGKRRQRTLELGSRPRRTKRRGEGGGEGERGHEIREETATRDSSFLLSLRRRLGGGRGTAVAAPRRLGGRLLSLLPSAGLLTAYVGGEARN